MRIRQHVSQINSSVCNLHIVKRKDVIEVLAHVINERAMKD